MKLETFNTNIPKNPEYVTCCSMSFILLDLPASAFCLFVQEDFRQVRHNARNALSSTVKRMFCKQHQIYSNTSLKRRSRIPAVN